MSAPRRWLGAALLLVVVLVSGGCTRPRVEALDIRFFSLTPDPLVVDVSGTIPPFTHGFRIGVELIGSTVGGSCAPMVFSSPLTGISLLQVGPLDFGNSCKDEGEYSANMVLQLDPLALRSQPSGNYAARLEIGRCVDSDLDPTPGAKDCVTSQRDFTIELRGAAPPAPPPAPQNFAAAVDGSAIVLTWRAERHALSYLLERQADNGAFTTLASLPPFTVTYRDGGVAPNTMYTYRLTAVNDAGSSAPVTASAQLVQMRNLSVAVEARGSDSVSSMPAGIVCPGDCSQTYGINQVVVLTPAPSTLVSGVVSRFWRWSGDPDCSDGSVTMDADKTCTAEFSSSFEAKLLTVATAGSGNGRVTSAPAGIDCPGLCSSFFALGTSATLTAVPAAGSVFVAWSGPADCSSGIPTMNADITCTAHFASIVPGTGVDLTIYIVGTGSVSSTAGVLCTSATDPCTAQYPNGTALTLVATPGPGQAFTGWAGSPDCADGVVGLTADTTCVANFVSTAAQWVTGAAALNQGAASVAAYILDPAIAVDASGQPVVAWTEDTVVYLYRPFGAGVTRVSENPSNAGPSLVMEASDGPLVAFTEESASDRRNVRLRRFPSQHLPGSVWADVGPGPLDTTLSADARDPSLVIRNGRITVAWVEGDAGVDLRIVVRSWDGSQWSAVGNGSGPATAASADIQSPRLVVTGTAPTQSLALLWSDDFQTLRVAELVGDDWVETATAPYPGAVQTDRVDMMWTTDLGLVVAAAPPSPGAGSIRVRRWSQGQWSDVGTPRGDPSPNAFLLSLAFSHGPTDATPLLAIALSRSSGALEETVVERFIGGSWVRLGNALPAIDRHVKTASPRGVAVADHTQPEVAVVLQGVVPGTLTSDRTLAVYRFE